MTKLPTRLTQALEQLTQLNKLGIHLLPVRHHSPACAYATQQALAELNPTHILIEGPASFNELLSDLQHLDNKPPLAVLCQTELSYQLQIEDSDEDTEKDNNDSPDKNSDKNIDKNTATQTDKTAQYETIKQLRSAYFPFCDYSPEWVALQFPLKHQPNSPNSSSNSPKNNSKNHSKNSSKNLAQVQFIDLSWSQQVAHDTKVSQTQDIEAKSLQQERYLAHSDYIKRLAEKLHCRDHDEVWEHLFELDGIHTLADWQGFFKKVLVWCAMSRLDYEESVLEAESSLVREAHMVERIVECYQDNKKMPMVIVTGGFHTLALIEQLYVQLVQKNTKKTKTAKTTKPTIRTQENQPDIKNIQTSTDQSWLIRYSFDRLDALNGYASGMPSPAFYQACWQEFFTQETAKQALQEQTKTTIDNTNNHNDCNNHSHDDLDENRNDNHNDSDKTQRESLVIDFFSEFSRQLRHQQIIQSSFINVKTASEQAIRLAELRGHPLIGRFDLMDACYSSFLKGSRDEGQHSFHQLLAHKLGGSRLGQVVSTTRTPPMLAQVYQLVKSQRFKLDDTQTKTSKLDVLRKPKHRERSSLLHLLTFLDVGFASRVQGPDFLHGGQLHLLFEEWHYAWTPQVEARLIELSETGSDIYQMATHRLLQQKQAYAEAGQNQSSAQMIGLLIQALMMGLHEHGQSLFTEIATILPHDPQLSSVLACGQHLVYLWSGKQFLQLDTQQKQQQLLDLIAQVPITALFLLSQLQTPSDDQVQETLTNLLKLRNLLKQISPILNQKPDKNNAYINTEATQSASDYINNDINDANNINDANVNDANSVNDTNNVNDANHTNSNDTKNTTNPNNALHNTLNQDFHQGLQRLRPSWQSLDLLLGAIDALAFVDGVCKENELADCLKRHFGIGANPKQAVAYLSGMMQAVPTLFLHYKNMTQMLDSLIADWDNDTFVSLLPDLRLSFTGLKPMQTNEFAEQVANLHDVDATQVTQYQAKLSEEDMMQGLRLNQQLEKVLQGRGLDAMFGNPSG